MVLTQGPYDWVAILLHVRSSCAICIKVLSETTAVDSVLTTDCCVCLNGTTSNSLELTRMTSSSVSILYSKVQLQVASYVKLAYVLTRRAGKCCGLVLKMPFDEPRMRILREMH